MIGKDSDAGRDWGHEEKGTTEDEMIGWHHQLNGHEFEQAPGVGDGQGGLACCSPWGHKELDMTERLTNNNSLPILASYTYNLFLYSLTMKVSHESENSCKKINFLYCISCFLCITMCNDTFSLSSYNLNYNKIEISI